MIEIALNGPGKNALGSPMMQLIIDRLEAAAGEPVLLTGSGDALSAGLDLREVASLDPHGIGRFLGLLSKMTNALYTYRGPLVALVNGHAIAGGCVIALACDWRVAQRGVKMKMGLNEVALGLRFPPAIMTLVKKRVETRHLTEVILEAGLHDAENAHRLGLLDEVVEDGRAAAERRLALLGAHPRDAYASAKREARGTLEPSEEEERRFAEDGLAAWTSPELKARIQKALSK